MNKFIIVSLVGLIICSFLLIFVVAPMFDRRPVSTLPIIPLVVFSVGWIMSLFGLVYHAVQEHRERRQRQIMEFLGDTDEYINETPD